MDRFDRCKKLFGDDFKKLQNASVLVFGVGGVGGVVVDCLARSGVGKIFIVDDDSFDITNQNRQLFSEEVGEKKVEVFKRKYECIDGICKRVDEDFLENFDFSEFDIVVDAIDDIQAKVAIAKRVSKKLICSLGSAKRIDPLRIKVSSIWKSYGDKFAKKFRYELKRSGFRGDFEVVFSDEEPKCKDLGSFVGVTGSFGYVICSRVIKRLIS